MRAETESTPPEPDEDEDGDNCSARISMDILDVGEVHRQAAIQLFDLDADDPERNAEAIVAVALAAAQLRGPDHHWALMQRLVAFDGRTAT